MPTITLRLDDTTKNELEALARGRGQSLSDLIRSNLDGLLDRGGDSDKEPGRLDIAPRSLTAVERQQLALLHRILARVVGDDNDVDGDKAYQLERASVLENGFVREYSTEFFGIHTELSPRDSDFVVDVLELFRAIYFSVQKLQEVDGNLDESLMHSLHFDGFDLADARESHLLEYARFLVTEDQWSELQDTFSPRNDSGNSHHRMGDVYVRMLAEYNKIKSEKRRNKGRDNAFLLDLEELQRLSDSQSHRDHRK